MKLSTRIALPLVLSVTAFGAIAADYTSSSPLTRAEVRAEAIAARDAGLIGVSEVMPNFASQPEGTMSRKQVRAELAEAKRLGLIASGDDLVFPTPQQSAQVRLAGLRAVQGDNMASAMDSAPAVKAAVYAGKTREQVRAEAIEARRLGLNSGGELTVFPTPQQSELIRQAGLRALQGDNMAQGSDMPVKN